MRVGGVRAALIVALGVLAVTHPARADAPARQGWWWAADPGGPVDVPRPADVPPEGLYVAANVTGTEAISALRFEVPPDASVGVATLKVAGEVSGTPSLRACPITGDWEQAQGGDWGSRPEHACEGAVDGTFVADARTVTFQVASLVENGALDIALVPSDGSGAFRIMFEKPGQDTLAVRLDDRPSPDAGSAPDAAGSDDPAGASGSSAGASAGSSAASGSFIVPDAPTPSPIVGDVPPIGSGAPTAFGAPPAAVGGAATGGVDFDAERRTLILLFALLLLLVVVYSQLSRVPLRAPRSLLVFGHHDDGAAAVDAPAPVERPSRFGGLRTPTGAVRRGLSRRRALGEGEDPKTS